MRSSTDPKTTSGFPRRPLTACVAITVAALLCGCSGGDPDAPSDSSPEAASDVRASAEAPAASPSPTTYQATDLSGRTIDLLSSRPAWAAGSVLVFVADDCPLANRYSPTLSRLAKEHAGRFEFFAVYAADHHTAEEARAHHEEYALGPLRPVLDDGSLRRATGVSVTPEAAVIGDRGDIVYRGRIDDWYVSFDERRPEPTQRDLDRALTVLEARQTVPEPWPEAIGCSLEARA
ncbi:MAG: hypothetical protein DWQ36_09930 [Acidobacteria bacterium]|nr:MAG: hypothetical protein DWQ30_01210 [Acidobacteriota bacterium]REK08376.1 MAG: hypothetical protein DWQ36_09930 [Acidobacteriota bacterium]